MTMITTHKDMDALTMTLVAVFDADVERVWQVWEDPRQLERWWGPPEWPATFVRHSLEIGATSHYFMTGPDGERMHGWWMITAVGAPFSLELDDRFADEDGNPTDTLGVTRMTVTLEAHAEQTRMTLMSTFENLDQLQQMIDMGMEEGLRLAVGQIDGLLAE
ncbi:MAG: SRPBCC domain-containing protein [Lacisediminihabitans sp.]